MSQPPASPPPPPAGPPPYYPPPPEPAGQSPMGPAGPTKTISILALVFGGASLLFALIPVVGIFLGGLFGIAAIVLGVIGIFKSHRLMAIIGIALAVVGLIVAVIVTIAAGKAVEEIVDDWPTDYWSDEGNSGEDGKKDEVVDGTDPNAPLPAGTEVRTGNWTVVISNVVPDATDEILEADDFGEPPAEGNQYYMFQVDATYEGQESSTAWSDLLFGAFIDNTVYTESCGFAPDDLFLAPEVFEGGTATGNVCISVPTDGADDAVISIEDYWVSGQRYFVAAD